MENWKQVPEYPLYDVSDYGRVRSWNNGRWGRLERPRMLKGTPDPKGYPRVRLYKAWGQPPASFKIHRLVLVAFVGPCPEGMIGCHNDDNKLNNHLSNLRWDTVQSNNVDKRLLKPETEQEIKDWYRAGDISQRDLARMYGVSQGLISKIVNR